MNTTKPSSADAPARCQHRTLKGRCRLPATDPSGTLCFDHARAAIQAKNDASFIPSLIRNLEDFQSATAINESLGAIHNLLAEGRISPRRGAVLAYVNSLLLRTLPAVQEENPPKIVFDWARVNAPDHKPASPSPDATSATPSSTAPSQQSAISAFRSLQS
jgi:hypothetical protein